MNGVDKWQLVVTTKDVSSCLYCGKKVRTNSVGYVSKFGIMHRNYWWKR